MTVANVDVAEAGREAGHMLSRAVVRLGVAEGDLLGRRVVTSAAHLVLGHDSDQPVLGFNPLLMVRQAFDVLQAAACVSPTASYLG